MILDKQTAEKKLRRMALDIAERNYERAGITLVGIKENGVVVAKKLEEFLAPVFRGKIDLIELFINKKNPGEIVLSKECDFNNKTIILIDDVANTGQTMLFALKPLLQHHPHEIQTLALVERTHKRFPIAVNYVGLSISTTLEANIVVEVEDGEVTGAWMR